ncbi:hypothetical protein [Brucella rhizosphaerae]|uniref:Uncharacterized protein n=1 Tax=Brucella rhizosphaerae TaxID=571254 RepID=A0A256FL90_9HYPH|nr:hypothetical protein [Brucella rhizosphaerae]OYR15476.1 hypothetical protein CEV32_4749 [Brucella rhizosphaerae]
MSETKKGSGYKRHEKPKRWNELREESYIIICTTGIDFWNQFGAL